VIQSLKLAKNTSFNDRMKLTVNCWFKFQKKSRQWRDQNLIGVFLSYDNLTFTAFNPFFSFFQIKSYFVIFPDVLFNSG